VFFLHIYKIFYQVIIDVHRTQHAIHCFLDAMLQHDFKNQCLDVIKFSNR